MTKKKTLVKESVVRRWGKLANMQPLTENWLDNLTEEDVDQEEDEAAHDEEKAHDEMDYAEGDLERADDSEMGGEAVLDPDVAEDIAAELIDTLKNKLSDMAGGAEVIDVVDDEAGDEVEMDMDMEVEMDDEVAMGDVAYNREDVNEEADPDWSGNEDDFLRRKNAKGVRKKRGDVGGKKYGKGGHYKGFEHDKKDKKDKKAGNRQDEELEIDMVDDESLTEAVLARVVERLLSKK